ncbi:response regulator transcription factor [Denitrificimonas sp. JX-1]|uniref:Response regulator transcription factor n=1 Tax=Denitrificimonas halotolerans TaxID=3098930 RepID=A0ABU5GTN1_9GAMM|nr:response regulator transcription factor [Denitrificimonas sp. JX-1]MDY7220329.1 response regulator transcription factor [Denitrificimonas sp. JX-1]
MKVLLVDDHAVVRQGYASLLQLSFPDVLIEQAESGEEAVQCVPIFKPHLVVMDISLPGISGLEACRRLCQRLPQLPVLFFSMHDELTLVRQALDAGAAGYISKTVAPDVLIDAVRRLVTGHMYIEQSIATQLACHRSLPGAIDPRLQSMTPREMEVFVMLARGVATQKIAQNLCISSKTVSNYMTLLKQKLQVTSQVELVHLAIDTGVLRIGEAS